MLSTAVLSSAIHHEHRKSLWLPLLTVADVYTFYRLKLCPVYGLSQVRGKIGAMLPSLSKLKAPIPTNPTHCGYLFC